MDLKKKRLKIGQIDKRRVKNTKIDEKNVKNLGKNNEKYW